MASRAAILRAIAMITEPGLKISARLPEMELARTVVDKRNTVGVGMGYRIRNGKVTNEVVLQYYVQKKRRARELPAAEAVPPKLEVAGEAVPTDVIEVGKVVPEKLATRKPLQPGHSIGHVNVTAGTFGALVTKGKAYHALSNSHVLAQSGKAQKGDKILYPGKADGGKSPADVVGKLSTVKKFTTGGAYVNVIDAASAALDAKAIAAKGLKADIKGLGIPKGMTKAKLGMQVTKTGRTTGTTTGKVIGIAARLQINYPVGLVGFRDQVLCTRYTEGGDSGSLVLDKKTKKAVGLHFAGSPGKSSFFNPIDRVLSGLGVKLVTKAVSTKAKRAPTKKTARRKTARPRRKA